MDSGFIWLVLFFLVVWLMVKGDDRLHNNKFHKGGIKFKTPRRNYD